MPPKPEAKTETKAPAEVKLSTDDRITRLEKAIGIGLNVDLTEFDPPAPADGA